MDVPGILTRTVDDCLLVFETLVGSDIYDSTTIQNCSEKFKFEEAAKLSVKNVRIGIPKEYFCPDLSAEVLETWIKVADLLENNGAHVEEVSMPYTLASIFVYSILNQCEAASNMACYDGIEFGYRADDNKSTESLYAKSRSVGFNSVVKNRILSGNYFLLRENYDKFFKKALKVRRLISQDFNNIFESKDKPVDLLLTPTTLSDAPFLKEFLQNSNRDQCAVQDFCTQSANMAGIPAITIPIRLSSKNLPLSLQLMGPKFSEMQMFQVAKWIESTVDFKSLVERKNFC